MPGPELIAERLTAQLLAGPPAGAPVEVAERLLAVQAQDQRGARLAVRARTTGLSAADVDRALTEERSLVITWLNRGTLHLVRSEDYPWLLELTRAPLFTGNARRLAQLGVSGHDADRGVAVIERSLAAEGPLTREQLRERVARAGVPTEGQAHLHLLMLACLRGLAVRGPMVGGRHAYALVRDWLREPVSVDRHAALAELARRYLSGHGPAGDRDLARWAGLPLRDARAALAAIAGELEERSGGLVHLARGRPRRSCPTRGSSARSTPCCSAGPRARSCSAGTGERSPWGASSARSRLVGGRAVATWRMPGGEVVLEPLERLRRTDAAALEVDAADVVRFLRSSRNAARAKR